MEIKHPELNEETISIENLDMLTIEKIESMEYFTAVEFKIPDGTPAIAHKFITKLSGNLFAQEDLFDKEKSGWLPLEKLENYPLSPDFIILLPKVKKNLL